MTTSEYRDLYRIADAAFQASLSRMKALSAEEAALRASLTDLDQQLRDTLGAALDQQAHWRAIGADEAWRRWQMRRRQEINMQLARLQVRKAQAAADLKLRFARKQVSAEILELQAAEHRMQERRRI